MGEKGVNVQDVPALDWSKKKEDSARKEYLKKAEEMHVSFNCQSAGLQYPHLGATPDGVIECECCGAGIIEIKCP